MSDAFSSCDFLAGWIGGMMGLSVGHPLDTIKVRQQILPTGSSIPTIVKSTYHVEGVRGFFKGMAYPLLGSGVYNAIFFGVYGNCLRWLQGMSGVGPQIRKMCCEGELPDSNWHRDVFIAGCVGGIATVLYSCPLELRYFQKVHFTCCPTLISFSFFVQASLALAYGKPCKHSCRTEGHYKGPYDAMVKIYSRYGLSRGLYKGTWTMMWRDVPTFGLYTLAYEHILCWFKKKEDRSPHTSITSQIVAGGIAGILSWVTVSPFDVVKSRIQADDFGRPIYNGMIDCLKKTVHQDGTKALFLGLLLATVRSFPVNAVTFVGYEYVIEFCKKCGYCAPPQTDKKKK